MGKGEISNWRGFQEEIYRRGNLKDQEGRGSVDYISMIYKGILYHSPLLYI